MYQPGACHARHTSCSIQIRIAHQTCIRFWEICHITIRSFLHRSEQLLLAIIEFKVSRQWATAFWYFSTSRLHRIEQLLFGISVPEIARQWATACFWYFLPQDRTAVSNCFLVFLNFKIAQHWATALGFFASKNAPQWATALVFLPPRLYHIEQPLLLLLKFNISLSVEMQDYLPSTSFTVKSELSDANTNTKKWGLLLMYKVVVVVVIHVEWEVNR